MRRGWRDQQEKKREGKLEVWPLSFNTCVTQTSYLSYFLSALKRTQNKVNVENLNQLPPTNFLPSPPSSPPSHPLPHPLPPIPSLVPSLPSPPSSPPSHPLPHLLPPIPSLPTPSLTLPLSLLSLSYTQTLYLSSLPSTEKRTPSEQCSTW